MKVNDDEYNLLMKNKNKEPLTKEEFDKVNYLIEHVTCELLFDEYALYVESMKNQGKEADIVDEAKFSHYVNVYFSYLLFVCYQTRQLLKKHRKKKKKKKKHGKHRTTRSKYGALFHH